MNKPLPSNKTLSNLQVSVVIKSKEATSVFTVQFLTERLYRLFHKMLEGL